MLIVSIPKSGSTALMETLGRVHALSYQQLSFEELELEGCHCVEEVKPLWLFHGDLSDVKEVVLKSMVLSREQLFKQHITPSEANLRNLENHKIVILEREPDQIIDSYYRGFQKNIHVPPWNFSKSGSIQEWRKYADESGLKGALEWWRNSWRSRANSKWLYVSFSDLTQNPGRTIEIIENHFDLKNSCVRKLVKARYSRSLITPYRYNRLWCNRFARIQAFLKSKESISSKAIRLVRKIVK